MKKKARSITVICTEIQRKANYVKKATLRTDGQYQVELTTNLREAKEYSRIDANNVVPKILNPYHREFTVEDTLVDWEKPKTNLVPGKLE